MWSLCNFLATDNTTTATNSSSHKRSGDGCCGTHRVDIHCNIPSVLAEDIMIEYNPALHWHDTIAWLHNGDGLNKAYRLRNQTNGVSKACRIITTLYHLNKCQYQKRQQVFIYFIPWQHHGINAFHLMDRIE